MIVLPAGMARRRCCAWSSSPPMAKMTSAFCRTSEPAAAHAGTGAERREWCWETRSCLSGVVTGACSNSASSINSVVASAHNTPWPATITGHLAWTKALAASSTVFDVGAGNCTLRPEYNLLPTRETLQSPRRWESPPDRTGPTHFHIAESAPHDLRDLICERDFSVHSSSSVKLLLKRKKRWTCERIARMPHR